MASSAPTTLWRLVKGHEHARAVILPGGPPYTLAFFVDEVMDRAENFDDMDVAVFRADDVKKTLVDEGWREHE